MLLRHADVRKAAKDYQTYSSDAPFRVPIPSEEAVRSIRQLPIERDPPEHTGTEPLSNLSSNERRRPKWRVKWRR